MCLFKMDKKEFMNFVHSYFGGILGAVALAFALGQNPINQGISFGIMLLITFVAGIVIVGFINSGLNK